MKTFKDLRDLLERSKKQADERASVFMDLRRTSLPGLEVALEKNFHKSAKEQIVLDYLKAKVPEMDADLKEAFGGQKDLVWKLLVNIALHKRTNVTSLLNQMKFWFKGNEPEEHAMDLLGRVEDEGLFIRKGSLVMPAEFLCLDKEDHIEDKIDCLQSKPPMVCDPKPCSGMDTGYLVVKDSSFTKRANHHRHLPKDFLNRVNAINYGFNYQAWDEYLKWMIPDAKRKDEDTDASFEYKQKQEEWSHFKRSFLVEFYKDLGIDTIHFPNALDSRARIYPKGSASTPQGRDIDKALLVMDPEPMTKEGEYWLKVSIANNYNNAPEGQPDLDKQLFQDRAAWTEREVCSHLELQPKKFYEWLEKKSEGAESPCAFYVQAQNLYKAHWQRKHGETPMLYTICHFDATCSGGQIQSILSLDFATAEMVNLIKGDGTRKDYYTLFIKEIQADGIGMDLTRSTGKHYVIMPGFYGSRNKARALLGTEEANRMFAYLQAKYPMWYLNTTMAHWWNENWNQYHWFLPDDFRAGRKVTDKVYTTAEYRGEEVEFVKEINTTSEWQSEIAANVTHSIDGFIAREMVRRCSWDPEHIHHVGHLLRHPELWRVNPAKDDSRYLLKRYKTRKLMKRLVHLGKTMNFYSYRILWEINEDNIDLVDPYILSGMLQNITSKSFDISEIHDSFGVIANHAGELMEEYRKILADLAVSDILPEIEFSLWGTRKTKIINKEKAKELAHEIRNSVYALC